MSGEVVEVAEATVETVGEVVETIGKVVTENPVAAIALASMAMATAFGYWMYKIALNSEQSKGA